MKHKKSLGRKSLLLLVMLIFSLCPPFLGQLSSAEAATGPLIITGTGLSRDATITDADWTNFTLGDSYYSTNNSVNSHKIYKVRGYNLWDIIGQTNLKTDQDYNISFIASDGFKVTKKVSELNSGSCYSDFTDASKTLVGPMLGFYQAKLIEVPTADFSPPISWTDREITEADKDSNSPRLTFGQQTINDMNESKWNKNVVKILVGEERPSVITISGNGLNADKQFTMAQLTSVPDQYKINQTYQYNSSSGLKTAAVKGVNLWYVLHDLVGIKDTSAKVQFIASDGYAMALQTQADISDPNLNYVLAYEVGGQAVSDDSGKGLLRIYRNQKTAAEFNTVFKAIIGISIVSDAGIDFTTSTYKHINYTGAPYNVDSITSATLTVEGPGVENYRALSLRQIEEANAGLVRGTYAETMGGAVKQNTYEGMPLSYLIDNFVTLKSNAGTIILKDKSRQTIAEYSLDDIRKTDYLNTTSGGAINLKMIVAYGVNEVPLVYLNSDTGYRADKYNDNGCFKLVVGQKAAGDPAPIFSNVAYVYVTEADAANVYEHTYAPYNDPKYTNYLLTLTGSGLGKEVNYSVADIESSAMDSIRQQKEYSLSNSEYFWYYNTYKGVGLWDLLLKAGLDPNISESTTVNLIAADNYNFAPLTIKDIKDGSLYGYYQKNENDLGDGNFDGSLVQPITSGYSPLVAYGFNGYPYVIQPTDAGYNSGLGNSGGPLRLIFGKKSYDDTNGSHQVQFLKKVIIGEDTNYTTHTYGAYTALATSPLSVKVRGDNNSVISERNYTVADIENMVYGVSAAEAEKAQVKDSYFTKVYNGTKISDLYEGVGLWYLLGTKVGLPGTTGTVTFKGVSPTTSEAATVTVNLEDLQKTYFNEVNGSQTVKPVLAYAKLGYPLVVGKTVAEGYVSAAKNNGGPLMLLFGQTTTGTGTPGTSLYNITEITVNVQQDPYAHLVAPYDTYGASQLIISGNGAKKQVTATVQELETLQDYIISGQYCLLNNAGATDSGTYKGLDLYSYLNKEVGFNLGATGVSIVAADGTSSTFTLAELAKTDYLNQVSGANDLKVMLAYGRDEKPLVTDTAAAGYDASAKNSGGPLQLIIGQTQAGDVNKSKCVKNVAEIVIEGQALTSWKHDNGVYVQYQDQPVLRVTGDQITTPRTFTVGEFEALTAQITRDTYTGDGSHEFEGVILWKLINEVVGLKDGITAPSIRVFSGQSYNQVLSNLDQVKNGVTNSQGLKKDIILAYAQDGYPLVPNSGSPGYDNNNAYGPLRLIVEESKSMWVKNTDCIVVGTGDYEEPVAPEPVNTDFTLYRNDDNSGLPLASIRSVTPDSLGGFWVGTYGGGAAYKNAQGNWTLYNTSNSSLPDNTVYDIEIDQTNRVWMAVGSAEAPKGVVCKYGDTWTLYNTANSSLPDNFVYTITPDTKGGLWMGTAQGAVYRDSNGVWTVYGKNDGIPAASVNVITPDSTGGVWFGCYPDTLDTQAGTYSGGYAYRDASGLWTNYSEVGNTNFGDNWIRSISPDKNGGAWITRSGNYAGGGKVDYVSATGQKQTYDDITLYPAIPDGDTIRLAAADQDGGLWMATKSSGLLYRNSQGEVAAGYNSGNGWPTAQWNNVYFLSVDSQGSVWAGTNGGVAYRAGEDNSGGSVVGTYTLTPSSDAVYTNGTTVDGINTMTVNSGVTGLRFFSVYITPVVAHAGNEKVVFVQLRNGLQINLNASGADFDLVQTSQAGFNVQPDDVIKVYIVDDLTNDTNVNPVILE